MPGHATHHLAAWRLVWLVLLAACAPTPAPPRPASATPTAPASTPTASRTHTRLPPSATLTPTASPRPTGTPRPTATPTLASTPTGTALPLVTEAYGRVTFDQPDDVSGYQIHVMYVLPSDGVDRFLDTNSTLATSVAAFQSWLAGQTGGPRLRLDTFQGELDLTFYRLPRADLEIASVHEYVRDEIQVDLQAAGFNHPQKIYAVYYDGSSTYSCGGGAWPPELVGNVAAMYLLGAYTNVRCADTPFSTSPARPGYWDYGMLHEIFHTLGAAPTCAPNHHRRGHTSDNPRDLMYAGDAFWQFPLLLDVGHDDYYGHADPACLDIARSVFLDPLPADPVAPPRWP